MFLINIMEFDTWQKLPLLRKTVLCFMTSICLHVEMVVKFMEKLYPEQN